jgi:hypothetical protein
MDCTLQVGDEVVCVSEKLPSYAAGRDDSKASGVVVGGVYIVSRLKVIPTNFPGAGNVLIEVREFQSNVDGPLCIWGYPHEWFRKVEKPKRETSIEVFRSIDRKVFDKPKVTA